MARSSTTCVTVFVVDDDDSIRRSLSRLFKSAGYQVVTFGSASEFLASDCHRQCPACLVLDVCLPDLTGMELQSRLHTLNSSLPIIFITGHGDIPMSVRAMKSGAVDFLAKPFDGTQLLEAAARAIEKNVADQRNRLERESIQARLATLTPREREVCELIVTGRLNKQVAAELGTVEKTVKVHRSRVMAKMHVQSLAELVRLAEHVGLQSPGTARWGPSPSDRPKPPA